MKNLKFILAITLFLFQLGTLYAFSLFEDEPEPIKIGSVILAGVISILLSSLIEALNHIAARTFIVKVWWISTARPAVWTFVIYIVLAVVDIYVPFLDAIIESIFKVKTDAGDTAALALTAYVVFPIIKSLLSVERTKKKEAQLTLGQKIARYKDSK